MAGNDKQRYRYTQVPSPLVQPGDALGLFTPKKTVKIGEDNTVQSSATKNWHTVQKQMASSGAAPKAFKPSMAKPAAPKVSTSAKTSAAKGSTNNSSSSKKSGSGCSIAFIIVFIMLIFAPTLLGGIAQCTSDVASSSSEMVFDSEFLDGIQDLFGQTESHADEVQSFADSKDLGDAELAFYEKSGDDPVEYYYASNEDAFISSDLVIYRYDGDSNAYYSKKNERLPNPYDDKYTRVDEDYCNYARWWTA